MIDTWKWHIFFWFEIHSSSHFLLQPTPIRPHSTCKADWVCPYPRRIPCGSHGMTQPGYRSWIRPMSWIISWKNRIHSMIEPATMKSSKCNGRAWNSWSKWTFDLGHSICSFPECFFSNMIGVEYILLHVQEPILYVIRKQHRHSPTEATPLADYYIIAGTVYQAPDLASVFTSRLVNWYFGDMVGVVSKSRGELRQL